METESEQSSVKTLAEEKLEINNVIQRIFLITVDKEPVTVAMNVPSFCVYLPDLAQDNYWLDWDNLDQGLFERLLMPSPGKHVVDTTGKDIRDSRALADANETSLLHYLLGCYQRSLKQNKQQDSKKEMVERCRQLIISYTVTALTTPDVLNAANLQRDIVDLFREKFTAGEVDTLAVFLDKIVLRMEEDDVHDFHLIFSPVLDITYDRLLGRRSIMNSSNYVYCEILKFFTTRPPLAKVLLAHLMPRDSNNGRDYEKNSLGCLLSLSCLVNTERGPYEFFDSPSRSTQQQHQATESSLWQPISVLNEKLYQVFFGMLKSSPEVKNDFLQWLGDCLQANSGRAKIWSIMGNRQQFATDSFMMNLGTVLLQLCKPFISPNASEKLLKIDPTYTKVSKENAKDAGVHMKGLPSETSLGQLEENEGTPVTTKSSYNFTTEIFFMTHKCLQLGFHCVYTQFTRLTRDLNRIQRAYEDSRRITGGENEVIQKIREEMDRGMTMFLCMKAALLEPQNLQLFFDLVIATSRLLNHYAVTDSIETLVTPSLPLPDHKSRILTCIPELFVDNMVDLMLVLNRFSHSIIQDYGEILHHLVSFIILFMGSPERMRNPHLRAKMAEILECVMPNDPPKTGPSIYDREQLFIDNPLAKMLTTSLIHVFVSIECTGDPNQFEQKFNYRRPMYRIMDHIWVIPLHRQNTRELCTYAEENIESVNPPLFLRFINLLLNDSIFLLDEAFQLLTQVKDMQRARDNDEWAELPTQQRQQRESTLHGYSQLTRFHNIMSNDTMHTLKYLARYLNSIFTCPSMIDRVASMLNYFLLHLTGPKMKALKVKDFNELDFKPQLLVEDIAKIYIGLGSVDAFYDAVSRDGRSYSDMLFPSAIRALEKIGKPELVEKMEVFAKKVQERATQQKKDEEILGEIPDEFLDPIMSTLMTDPVLLPSSKLTVDRTTIARHLLSDQTDPFNRSPLSMEQVIPNTELKDKIDQWLAEHRKPKQGDSVSQQEVATAMEVGEPVSGGVSTGERSSAGEGSSAGERPPEGEGSSTSPDVSSAGQQGSSQGQGKSSDSQEPLEEAMSLD
ncbi:ubiquitin conjugation factor E4 A-like [Ptychodera flava]|uniref:ubiquitin conjugation factor E4 A-like n=1 Tax=Ptychodera flava TaxID=63121 RepID=UPI00396A5587